VKNSVVVDENMVLITGHTTLKAMQSLGWKTSPAVTQVFGLTEEEKRAYRIADNKLGELAEWDLDLLALELDDLRVLDFDLDQTGFDDKELGKILDTSKEASEDDYERRSRSRLASSAATSSGSGGTACSAGTRPVRRMLGGWDGWAGGGSPAD